MTGIDSTGESKECGGCWVNRLHVWAHLDRNDLAE